MNRYVKSLLLGCGAFAIGATVVNLAVAQQAYPNQPIRVVVHLAAGGGLDAAARIIGQSMTKSLGQPIVVENRTGAAGTIATQYVKQSKNDGYTLQMGNASTHAANPAVDKTAAYDPIGDFSCISFVGDAPSVAVVPASMPVKNLQEFIAYAKSQPGKLNYVSGSTEGSAQHLQGELFKKRTGIDMVHIPYDGAAPALTSLVAGETQFFIAGLASAIEHVKGGRLKVLAITGNARSSALPDVPTFLEEKIPGFEVGPWYALMGPKGIPQDIVTKLNGEVLKALKDETVIQRFNQLAISISGTSAVECTTIVTREAQNYAVLAKELGIGAK
jgi:tripartite-type tricarboxylate transporter receptor subunit TctC